VNLFLAQNQFQIKFFVIRNTLEMMVSFLILEPAHFNFDFLKEEEK